MCTIQHSWFYSDFLPNIWVSYQVRLLSLGPVGPWEGRAQFLKCVHNSTFLILSWFLCQTFGGVIKLDCCRALRGEGTISKRCVQFNILDSILIFVPNNWGSYQVGLLSLGPVVPWERGGAQFLKCVYNSTFLILSWFLCQTFGGVIKLDCCLWALSGPEGGGHIV